MVSSEPWGRVRQIRKGDEWRKNKFLPHGEVYETSVGVDFFCDASYELDISSHLFCILVRKSHRKGAYLTNSNTRWKTK